MSKVINSHHKHTSVLPAPRRGTDRFTVTIPDGEAYHGCLLTLLESDSHSGAKVVDQPRVGARGMQEIRVEWWHGMGDKVAYQFEAFSGPLDSPPDAPLFVQHRTGFSATRHGFRFMNRFPPVPDIVIPIPFGRVELGKASDGLCGGMVFCALDYFLAGRPVPDAEDPPTTGDLFDAIVRRLLNSFNLPLGVLNYIVLMHPDYPDGEARAEGNPLAPHGRAWQTLRVEWPVIKKILDAGQPCPLGLVRIKSTDLSKLGQNHQVLATGYEVVGDTLSLSVYDPNFPRRDDLTLRLSLAAPEQPTSITYSAPDSLPVFAFFHVHYKFRSPPM